MKCPFAQLRVSDILATNEINVKNLRIFLLFSQLTNMTVNHTLYKWELTQAKEKRKKLGKN